MAITQLQIDGVDINFINFAQWTQRVIGESLDMIAVHSKQRQHVWSSDVMTAPEYVTLLAKRGSIVSITVPDVNDRNADFVTYFGAKVQSATFQNHEGPNIRGFEMRFLVRV